MDDKIKHEKKARPAKAYVATNLLKSIRFSLLPESVQDLGRELINRAKAGEKVELSNPEDKYFKEAN